MNSRLSRILLITDCRWNTIQLQPCACSTRPRIRGSCIALDLSSSTPLTCSHDLQSFMPIMFVDEYIVCYMSALALGSQNHGVLRCCVISRGARPEFANWKLVLCADCGSRGRAPVAVSAISGNDIDSTSLQEPVGGFAAARCVYRSLSRGVLWMFVIVEIGEPFAYGN